MASDTAELSSRRRPAESEPVGEGGRERCPRCDSRDTKFCYYNNYNTSQPRHFCKSCRRYWTLGGSLRNVPIGGSSRKRLRPSPAFAPPPAPAARPSMRPFEPGSAGFGQLFSGPLLALGEPFLDRAGFGLGLGLGIGTGQGGVEDVGFGLGTAALIWPPALLDEDVRGGGGGDAWRMGSGGGGCFEGTVVEGTGWKEVAVAAPGDGSGGADRSRRVH